MLGFIPAALAASSTIYFFPMWIMLGIGIAIINLEVRYKGSYTANPQFQAVATADFKNMFKE